MTCEYYLKRRLLLNY